MQLDVPLGRWYTVERNTWYRCYKSEDCLYFRGPNEDVLQRFKKSRAPGFYTFDCNVAKVPLKSHPVQHQQVGEAV